MNKFKSIIVIASLVFVALYPENSSADVVKLENEKAIFKPLSNRQAQAAAKMVKHYGYSCDSISKFKPLILSDGFNLICNKWRYEYDLVNVGGKYIVKPQ